MNHAEWNDRVKSALRQLPKDPKATADALLEMAPELEAMCREILPDYHLAQTLGLAAFALEGVGDGASALDPLDRQIALLRGQLVEAAKASTSANALRALVLFRLGRPQEAATAVCEALRTAAVAPGSDYNLERALTQLREYQLSRERPPA